MRGFYLRIYFLEIPVLTLYNFGNAVFSAAARYLSAAPRVPDDQDLHDLRLFGIITFLYLLYIFSRIITGGVKAAYFAGCYCGQLDGIRPAAAAEGRWPVFEKAEKFPGKA